MQFKTDDFVVHPIYGIGHIEEIEEKQFSEGENRKYYKIILSRSTIWIPVESQETVGLRAVTAKSDLDQYRDLLKSDPIPLKNDQPKQQHMELTKRLKESSFQIMCEVVRDLTASSCEKPLGSSYKATLQKTRDRLCQEWATAANIPLEAATKEINSLLNSSQ